MGGTEESLRCGRETGVVGVALLGTTGLFFLAMMGMMPRSNDPAALMSTLARSRSPPAE
jgi:hypothetical protein